MKDSSFSEAWTSSITLRMHYEPSQSSSEAFHEIASPSTASTGGETTMPATIAFTRSSAEGLAALSNLSEAASILLFTPVLSPAQAGATSVREDTDPFESFGRALSAYHKRIRHVPFLPKIGYTDTHAAFLSQADAIVVVMCEPGDNKDHRIPQQMGFALRVLEAVQGKEANAANTLVLIQCANEEHRMIANASFKNVIEVSAYDDGIAKQLAQAIFEPPH